jgi:hypothetical protein
VILSKPVYSFLIAAYALLIENLNGEALIKDSAQAGFFTRRSIFMNYSPGGGPVNLTDSGVERNLCFFHVATLQGFFETANRCFQHALSPPVT